MNKPVTRRHVLHTGSGYLDFLPVVVVNTLLVMATFNLYIFWAKTNVRSYLWRTTRMQGKSLEYTGEGTDLARGFCITVLAFLALFGYPGLIALSAVDIDSLALALPDPGVLASLVLAVIVPVAISAVGVILWLAPEIEASRTGTAVSFVVLWLGLTFFIAASRHLTYRYLLRHTRWRGADGNVAGSTLGYALRMLPAELSVVLSLGWSGPWRFVRRFSLLLNHATFAGLSVQFEASAKVLYPRFAVAWFAVVALTAIQGVVSSTIDPEDGFFGFSVFLIGSGYFTGLVSALAWYNARVFAHVAEALALGDVRFRFTATPTDITKLYLTNFAMNVLSAGFGYYYSRMRIARFIVKHLEIHGEIATAEVGTQDWKRKKQLLGEGAEILLAGSYF